MCEGSFAHQVQIGSDNAKTWYEEQMLYSGCMTAVLYMNSVYLVWQIQRCLFAKILCFIPQKKKKTPWWATIAVAITLASLLPLFSVWTISGTFMALTLHMAWQNVNFHGILVNEFLVMTTERMLTQIFVVVAVFKHVNWNFTDWVFTVFLACWRGL